MDAILPALIAILLAEMGGKTQALVHLAGGERGAGKVLTALLLTTLIGLGVAGFGGAAIAHMLTPDARLLLAGLALVSAGAPMLLPARKRAKSSPRHLIPALAASQFGDASQFIVFAIAARTDMAALAVTGGLIGTLGAMLPPLAMARDWPGGVPVSALRTGSALLLIFAGLWLGVSALRLI